MEDVRMINKNGYWNIFIGAEWYAETRDYETACDIYNSLLCSDEDDYQEDY